MNERMHILSQIDYIHENHCMNCTKFESQRSNKYCTTVCPVGADLMELGDKLLKPRQDKVNRLLGKGQDLTWQEIESLMNRDGVTQLQIAKALGITREWFLVIYKKYKESKKREVEVI